MKKNPKDLRKVAFKILTEELGEFSGYLAPESGVYEAMVRLKILMDAFVVYMWEVERDIDKELEKTKKKRS